MILAFSRFRLSDTPRRPKRPPRLPQDRPRGPQEGPKRPPREPQDGQRPPRCPRTAQKGPKTAQKGPKGAPKGPPKDPPEAPETPNGTVAPNSERARLPTASESLRCLGRHAHVLANARTPARFAVRLPLFLIPFFTPRVRHKARRYSCTPRGRHVARRYSCFAQRDARS